MISYVVVVDPKLLSYSLLYSQCQVDESACLPQLVVHSMVGLVGRSSFLLNCRLGQYSRRCSVVSAGLSQRRQCGWCSGYDQLYQIDIYFIKDVMINFRTIQYAFDKIYVCKGYLFTMKRRSFYGLWIAQKIVFMTANIILRKCEAPYLK